MIVKDYKQCPYFKDGVDNMAECIVCNNACCPKIRRFNIEEKPKTPNQIRETNGLDPVNRPAHYTDGKIEVIDYIEDKKLGFCLGNAIKYISRAGKKNPDKEVEDLNKAIWYIKRRIKEIEEGIA